MPEVLSRAALEDMLQTTKVDVGNGTLFGVPKLRKPGSSRLTLVISTGGSKQQTYTCYFHRRKRYVIHQRSDAYCKSETG